MDIDPIDEINPVPSSLSSISNEDVTKKALYLSLFDRFIPSEEILTFQDIRSKTSSIFLKIGSTFLNPIFYCVGSIIRLRSPMLPNRYTQCDTKIKEIAKRTLLGLTALALLTPVGVITGFNSVLSYFSLALGTALIGGIFRVTGALLQKDGYHYVPGNAPEKKTPNFSLMTWNILGMPVIGTLAGGLPLDQGRIDRIIKQIKDEDPDVLVLQEVMGIDLCTKLTNSLKDQYPHFYTQIGANLTGPHSGLFVASKLPVKDFKFTPYKDTVGYDIWGNLGFASFSVQTTNHPVHVIGSHMQSPETPTTDRIEAREKGFKQVLKHLETVKDPAFFVGDLNIIRDKEEYQQSSLSKYFEPTYKDTGNTCTDYFEDESWRTIPPRHSTNILDYIVRLSKDPKTKKQIPLGNLQVETTRVLAHEFDTNRPEEKARSDHHALLAKITTAK